MVRGSAARNAINAPIQGSAADIIIVAMAHIYQRFQAHNLKAKMILQVHDERNFSVPEAEKELVQKIVIEEMEQEMCIRDSSWVFPLSISLISAMFFRYSSWLCFPMQGPAQLSLIHI